MFINMYIIVLFNIVMAKERVLKCAVFNVDLYHIRQEKLLNSSLSD